MLIPCECFTYQKSMNETTRNTRRKKDTINERKMHSTRTECVSVAA